MAVIILDHSTTNLNKIKIEADNISNIKKRLVYKLKIERMDLRLFV